MLTKTQIVRCGKGIERSTSSLREETSRQLKLKWRPNVFNS